MLNFWLAIIFFVLAYVFIVIEKVHRTVVVWIAAALLISLGVISQEKAVQNIDFNTLWLLIGMMVIVGITRKSGVFEYIAIKSAKIAKGRPVYLLIVLGLVTSIASAFLDNVTTVLLIVPVTFALTDRLDISPIPFLIAEIMSSNIGGTATLIGDPPNIMIGSATSLGFLDFALNLTLPVLIILLITLVCLLWIFKKDLKADADKMQSIMALDEKEYIREWSILKKSLLVLGLTILGFLLHQSLHLESATVALLGAGLLLLITREEPEEVLLSIEWPTIFFFAGLFVLVGGLKVNGVISVVAQKSLQVTGHSEALTGILVLWLSAIASAFIDNIPFVATMIPLLQNIGQLSSIPMDSVWWALSLGACLGGNGTLIGASANVIVAGISERHGIPITFMDYLKIGFPLMLLSIVLSMVYLYLFFWM